MTYTANSFDIPGREIVVRRHSVGDIATIFDSLRAGVEAVLLDQSRPAADQIAAALAGRRGLAAVHIIAHGAPGRVSFAAGDWLPQTFNDKSADFAAIGAALAPDGDLRLWSCRAGAGKAGEALIQGLARATGAEVSASTGLIGAAALGGGWDLAARSRRTAAGSRGRPPLTDFGMARYAGVLVTKTWSTGTTWSTAALDILGCLSPAMTSSSAAPASR